MNNHKLPFRKLILPSLFAALFATSGWALADPPSRVARLSYVSGAASFSPGGERDWARATINRPMITGDRLWVEPGARAELQLGAAAVRVGGATSLTLLNLNDRIAQVQLAQGTLVIRVRRLDRGEVFEIDTPNLAYIIRRPGSYRVEVDPDGRSTLVSVRSGLAEAHGEGRAFVIGERQTFRFHGRGLSDYQTYAVYRADELDRWSSARDQRWDKSPSRRYVSAEMIGYEDLDQNGTWRKTSNYGMVWVPSRVPANWAPYREGHWAWVEPWGWTWIDEQAWGFAPSHYGRWARIDTGWAWVPGPATVRPVYAPALVAFVGGDGPRSSGGQSVGWFPLGPREVYRPSYAVSREYFSNINTSNTAINRTVVTTYYGNPNPPRVTYMNQAVPGAVIAVLAAAFAQSRPVHRETVTVTRDMITSAPARAVPRIAPVQASVLGAAAAPSAKPPENVQTRAVVAQVAPPPPPAPFSARQGQLAANTDKPHDTAAAKPAAGPAPAAAPAPTVTVVAPQKPVAAPPRPASAPAAAASPAASSPAAPASAAAPAPAAPQPAASARPDRGASGPAGRDRSGERDRPGERERPGGRDRAATGASAPAPAAAPAPAPAPTPAPTPAPAPAPAPTPAPAPRASPAPAPRAPAPAAPAPAAAAAPAPAPSAAPATATPPAASAPAPRERRNQRGDEERGNRERGSDARGPNRSATPPSASPAPAPAPMAAPAPAPTPAPAPARAPESAKPPAPAPAPVTVPAPPPPAAAAPVPRPPAPPEAAPPGTAEQRGPRARQPSPNASARREAASEAREERSKRRDEEQGRKP
jgi:hypothetical protein